jgi:hypothetical protein
MAEPAPSVGAAVATAAPAKGAAATPTTIAPETTTQTAMDKKDNRSILQLFLEFVLIPIDTSMFKIAPEIGHLAPIILTGGALFLSAVTVNYPMFMFALASIEASVFYNMLANFSDYIVTPTFGVDTTPSDKEGCKSYFQTLTPSRFGFFFKNGLKKVFPNYPLYYITFAATYCIQGLMYYSEECSQMGPEYSNRPYLAIIGASMFIVLYMLYLFVYGCDTNIVGLLSTVILAIVVGYLISFQNYSVFGKPSVNMLFIPQLIKRTGMDFVCVSTADKT